jgi:two-component system NtrC family response regulator
MNKTRLLVIEDDEEICTQLKYALREDYALWFAHDRTEALTLFNDVRPALITLDLGLPPSPNSAEEGLAVLEEILRSMPSTKIVVLTGNTDRQNALKAVELGAFDYHGKPIDLAQFKVVLQRAAYLHGLELETEGQIQAVESSTRFEEILGNTAQMREIFGMVKRVAMTDATVLIEGESGTGKELLARAIHAKSIRHERPFVPINCGAIPETLLESELFGHEKGAYTGAHIQRKGKLEVAAGGTLFLDEIGEMSPPLQVKLLRFLQEREIERVGGRERLRLDVRIVAATNKILKSEIQTGRFRQDFYYRLSVVTITLPPLRERGEDIILLANAFLRHSCREYGRKVRFSREALHALMEYSWPGNIRELENRVQRAVIMARGRFIEPSDVGMDVPSPPQFPKLREVRTRAEREALVDALIKTKGNISQAARELGVSRPTFHSLLDKHHVNARGFR